jgi:hypothetical protein
MDSPELLELVENCPPGGETLILRMLHILTEGGTYLHYSLHPLSPSLGNWTPPLHPGITGLISHWPHL